MTKEQYIAIRNDAIKRADRFFNTYPRGTKVVLIIGNEILYDLLRYEPQEDGLYDDPNFRPEFGHLMFRGLEVCRFAPVLPYEYPRTFAPAVVYDDYLSNNANFTIKNAREGDFLIDKSGKVFAYSESYGCYLNSVHARVLLNNRTTSERSMR